MIDFIRLLFALFFVSTCAFVTYKTVSWIDENDNGVNTRKVQLLKECLAVEGTDVDFCVNFFKDAK